MDYYFSPVVLVGLMFGIFALVTCSDNVALLKPCDRHRAVILKLHIMLQVWRNEIRSNLIDWF
jgi:hypothetical protein